MNFRLTAILFAVVFALVVGLLLYAVFSGDPSNTTDGPFAPLTSAGVKAADVTSIEIARTNPRDEKLAFEKRDGRWRLTAPADAGVDPAAVDQLVRQLLDLQADPNAEPLDPATAGVFKPEVTVTLKAGERATSVRVGKTTAGKDKARTYMATDGPTPLPMAVPAAALRGTLFRTDAQDGPAAALVKWRTDFRPRAVLGSDVRDAEADTDALTITRGDKSLALARKDDAWRIATPDLGPADVNGASEPDPARFTGIRPLLNAVLFLQTTSPADVTEDVPAGDLPKYGLTTADAPFRVTFTPKGKPAQVLLVGKRITDKDGKPTVPPRHYVKLEGDAAVFAVSTDLTERLANTLNDPTPLQSRDLIPVGKQSQIDAIDSSTNGGFKLRRLAGEQWAVYGGGGEPADSPPQAVPTLLGKLATPRLAVAVLPKPDDAAFEGANLRAELKLWANGIPKAAARSADGKLPPEPAPTGEPIVLRIGREVTKSITRPDGTAEERKLAIVRRIVGKEAFDLEVPAEVATAALQPRLMFINARPPQFVPSQATGLVLFRDGVRTEYLKNPTTTDPAYRNGVWNVGTAQGPTADGDGVFTLLSQLSALPATLVMEKADDLKPLGLDPANPKLSAKVTLPGDKGPRTEEFHFGEPVKGNDKAVYFKAVDQPFIYSVPIESVLKVRISDLTDKVAFRLDPTRVKQMTFRGWPNTTADKTPAKVVAEQQNGTWAIKEPKGATLDVGAMQTWLAALQHPKRVGPAPVEEGKEPPAAYGFGLDAVKLFVVSQAEKASDPDVGLDLTLGALTADKSGVYARLSDGRVFLLDAAPFAPVLPRPPVR
ncbi:MAG: DUF4340 domain-containing protein [Fimbriiglobus sp.]|jgi:hypothetical protein|nr:DUF4340 domain-containing protein [Fimbriiglobus sp.]